MLDSNRTLTLTWSEAISDKTHLHVSFQHRCLDKYKHYVTRTCQENGWLPERNKIICSYLIDEYAIRTQCPPNFNTLPGVLDNIRICFRIIREQPWTNICLSSGSSLTLTDLNLSDLFSIQKQFNRTSPGTSSRVSRVWLPAKQMWSKLSKKPIQDISDKFMKNQTTENSIKWTLAGIFGIRVPFRNIEVEHFDGCVLTQWQSIWNVKRVLADCNDRNTMVCLYNQREPTM